MAYIYKAKVKKKDTHHRCIWGNVARPHGNSAIVRAKFKSNLPPKSMGTKVGVLCIRAIYDELSPIYQQPNSALYNYARPILIDECNNLCTW